MQENTQGNLYIVAAPSGGGKTSLVKKLVSDLDNIAVSISHTTRSMRPGEQEGVDYFFVNNDAFLRLVDEHAFIEHAEVFQHFYGTSINQIQARLAAGIDIVLDIDWQGAAQIHNLFADSVSIFILPPSLEALMQRLIDRGRDDEETIAHRMLRAKAEMKHLTEFDYLIVNDDFDLAAQQLAAIVTANRLKTDKQKVNQAKLLSFLLTQ
jgi:guanylate kinase